MRRLLAFAALAAAPAGAQATLRGTVHDSLFTRQPLADAVVMDNVSGRIARTDQRGRFAFDSVTTPRAELTFFHPSLDAAGVAAPVVGVAVAEYANRPVLLTTPGVALVQRALCGQELAPGFAILTAAVRAGDAPAAGARVVARWSGLDLAGRRAGVRTDSLTAVTDAAGTVRFCGVPATGELTLTADRAGARGEATTELADAVLAARELALVAERAAGIVYGVAQDPRGAPLPGAVVMLDGDRVARSDSAGRFRFDAVAPGPRRLEVRRVGFEPQVTTATAVPGDSVRVIVSAGPAVNTLGEVRVSERRDLATISGFDDRRRTSGFGTFLDADQIAKMNVTRTSEIFPGKAGTRLSAVGARRVLQMTGANGRCEANVYLDGTPVNAGRQVGEARLPGARISGGAEPATAIELVEASVRPDLIAGIEIYPRALLAPPMYPSLNGCGVVLIWTKWGADPQ
jgi:hypothetical protein